MSTLNERISSVVEASGNTKTKFAETVNISQPFLSQICSGAKIPSDRTITDICREYNVNERWLRTGEGEMFVKLSRNDEIAAYVARIMKDEDAELQRFLIQLMSRIPSDCWQVIEAKAKELAAEK